MDFGHTIQPGFAQLRGAGVGFGQAVLQVHQHLWVFFMFLHLLSGHEYCPDPLGQVLHIRGKSSVLREQEERAQDEQTVTSDVTYTYDLNMKSWLSASLWCSGLF